MIGRKPSTVTTLFAFFLVLTSLHAKRNPRTTWATALEANSFSFPCFTTQSKMQVDLAVFTAIPEIPGPVVTFFTFWTTTTATFRSPCASNAVTTLILTA